QLVARFQTVVIECHPRLVGPSCIEFQALLESTMSEEAQGRRTGCVSCRVSAPNPAAYAAGSPSGGRLQVALGLETVHPDVLPRLNKRMTLPLFEKAVRFLRDHDIAVRAFVLLRPPFLTEAEGIEWAIKSLRYAFDVGVEC